MSRPPLPSRSVPGISGLVIVAFLAVSQARQASPTTGEELYVDRLGCWNCHGNSGEGGAGPGTTIGETRLSLRSFVKQVRLPRGQMPQYATGWVSDAELAILYHWLDGAESVRTPLPIVLTLTISTPVAAHARGEVVAEAELKARNAETMLSSRVARDASLRYRVLLAQPNTPVANKTIEYQLAGRNDWSKFTTNEQGEQLLGSESGFILVDGTAVRLRMSLAAGRYALVVEAIDYSRPDSSRVIGIGSAVLTVE